MARVGPYLDVPCAAVVAQAVDAGVHQFVNARQLRRNAQRRAIQHVEHEPVRDDHHQFAIVAAGDFLETGEHPRAKLQRAFAARNDVSLIAALEARVVGGMVRRNFAAREAFEYTEMALAKARLENDVVPGHLGNAARGVLRAPRIPSLERAECNLPEMAREQLRLAHAGLGQRAVGVPLHAALLVPYRLAVADQNYLSHVDILASAK